MKKQNLVLIAGSAGSLGVLSKIFDRAPLEDAAYIIVRHLPVGYHSRLESILKGHSRMKVQEVKDNAVIESQTIYYAPANDHVFVDGNRLRLQKRQTEESNKSIDILFTSVDENVSNCIAVVLSGLGNDGAYGAHYIKNAGGTVIVQSPDTCEFPDLPRLIIANNDADHVLTPEDIPVIIGEICGCDVR